MNPIFSSFQSQPEEQDINGQSCSHSSYVKIYQEEGSKTYPGKHLMAVVKVGYGIEYGSPVTFLVNRATVAVHVSPCCMPEKVAGKCIEGNP